MTHKERFSEDRVKRIETALCVLLTDRRIAPAIDRQAHDQACRALRVGGQLPAKLGWRVVTPELRDQLQGPVITHRP